MKLRDNMTMEAYNVWGGVPPRKCRPPKIGDIPKHSAVDEESPGSISKSLAGIPSDPRESSLNIPLDSSRHIVFPLESSPTPEQFPSVRKYEPRISAAFPTETNTFQFSSARETQSRNFGNRGRDLFSSVEQDPRRVIKRSIGQESSARKSPEPHKSRDHARKVPGDSESTVTINLPSLKSTKGEDSSKIPSSPEDVSDPEIVEVRKDSALFLEVAEGLPTVRDILRPRAPKIIRPRRESSGYASNLGTFDDDRRNSSSVDVIQDLSVFLKDRRRSSTAPKRLSSRVILGRAEESFTEEVTDISADRMPTTEIHRKMSSAGLEMPNIEEVKEVLRDDISSRQESLDNLCNLMKHVSAEELSARCRLAGDPTDREVSSTDNGCTETGVLDISKACVIVKLQDLSASVFDTTSLGESINRVPTSTSTRNTLNRALHQYTVPSSANSSSKHGGGPNDKPGRVGDQLKTTINVERAGTAIRLNDESIGREWMQNNREEGIGSPEGDADVKGLPRSIKVYQLLSTQSEDRTDGELHLTDRRISLQISKQDDATQSAISSNELKDVFLPKPENITASKGGNASNETGAQTRAFVEIANSSVARKVPSSGEVGTTQRFLGDSSNVSERPIYPYCPYSPYGSPQGSPRNRRRPLRESRRVSIDNRQGALQLNQYKLLDNIGQGSYGIVKLVYNEEDETHYAMKILSKKKLMKKAGIFGRMAPGRKGAANPLAKVYREIALLKKLDHPNVVKLVEVLDDPDEDNLYLVFELVQRGEILQIPTERPLDEDTTRKNFRDVVMGVEYLHYQRIVHRDIKPSNLLVDSNGRIKIADLGVSAELRASGELLSGPAGTPAFAAPETTTPGAHYSGTLCDVWSMGVTLYSLATGRIPWDGAGSIIGVQVAVRTEPLKFPEEPTLTQDLRDLLLKMLAKDPAERITLPEIKDHPWLTNRGLEPLPSEADNCRLPVTVTDEEVERVVTRIPKLDTLILIKTMLKQHSFQNPFLPKKNGKATCADVVMDSIELSRSGRAEERLVSRNTVRNAKTERFQRAGRSNSAPDSYDWQTNGRQVSIDSSLPPVTEASSQETDVEKR